MSRGGGEAKAGRRDDDRRSEGEHREMLVVLIRRRGESSWTWNLSLLLIENLKARWNVQPCLVDCLYVSDAVRGERARASDNSGPAADSPIWSRI